jgi:hypothetical protein
VRRNTFWVLVLFAVLAGIGIPAHAEESPAGKPTVECKLVYSLKGWSAFYKTAKGEGKVTCDNGQSADVTIQSKGGGLTFGKTAVYDGKGTFSKVHDISAIFGGYAAAEAHAGAAKSASAQALTKGEVSLALAGTGQGVDLGVAFSKLTIKKK